MFDRLFTAPRMAGVVFAAFLATSATGALAQSNPDLIHLQDRVERLEGQLRLHGVGQGVPDGDSASAAALSMRIGQLEEQLRRLNGEIEQMAHAVRQMQQQLGQGGELRGSGDDFAGNRQGMDSGGWRDLPQVTDQPGQRSDSDRGEAPRILGQVPGQPLDLSGSIDLPGGFGQSGQQQDGQVWSGDAGGGSQLASVPMTGDPRDDYDTAYGYILRGDFGAAEAGFRQYLAHYPDNELAGNAQFWLGESLFARARYRDAADAYLAGYTEYPDNAKAPDSLFKLGLSLKELGQREAACATLAEIDRRYPNAPQVVRDRARSEMDKSGC